MWELDYKESWVPKNWCFWTVVLEKTLEWGSSSQLPPRPWTCSSSSRTHSCTVTSTALLRRGRHQKMASERHTSFCQKQWENSESPYVQSFRALSWNPGLRDSCHMSPCYLSVFCPPLSLSIRFPRRPLLDLSCPHDLLERILRFPLVQVFLLYSKAWRIKSSPNILKIPF